MGRMVSKEVMTLRRIVGTTMMKDSHSSIFIIEEQGGAKVMTLLEFFFGSCLAE